MPIAYTLNKYKCIEQEDAEKFEHFVTSLKLLLNDCGYDAAIHDEIIRDSIVFGVKSSKSEKSSSTKVQI